MTTTVEDEELRAQAILRLRKKHEFWSHVAAWVLVNAFLVAIWAVTGSGFFWPIFFIVGWGIGLFFHGWDVYYRAPSEDRIQQEMRRLGDR